MTGEAFLPRFLHILRGMENLKIYLIESPFQDKVLLGRKVKEYVEREFEGADVLYVQSVDEIAKAGTFAVIPLDCPLVSRADVERAAKGLRLKGASCLKFERSSAYVARGGGDGKTIFATSTAFFEISDAISYYLVYNILKDRIVDRHLSNGVLIFDRATTFIDDTVEIGAGANILPFCRIEGGAVIEKCATVSASYVLDSRIRARANVQYSHVVDSVIGEGATVGPFARLRGATIGKGCRIGDFVEVKKSVIGDGAKSAHLAYIGDATVGERTNVGCGTVFCNYDGQNKHQTSVGSDCFLGANVNLVAPVAIGDNCFVAAGTTITQDLDDGTFAKGRAITKTAVNQPKTDT